MDTMELTWLLNMWTDRNITETRMNEINTN